MFIIEKIASSQNNIIKIILKNYDFIDYFITFEKVPIPEIFQIIIF